MTARADDFHPPKPMPRLRTPLRLALAAALALPPAAAAQTPVDTRSLSARDVVLDGLTHEWDATPPVFAVQRGSGAPRYAAVERVKVRHDADAVYLQLTLNGEFVLQGLPGTLALLLDADADSRTGRELHGMRGVDAAIEFSAALGDNGARMGTGLRLMRAGRRAAGLTRANVAGVMSAPTHASRWHEVRIPRGGAIPFGRRMAARLVSMDAAGRVVDRTRVFTADLADARPRPTHRGAGPADPLARAAGTDFRVVSWNVGRENLFEQPDAFGAVLRPLAPDLLMLDEVAGGHTQQEVEDLLNRVLPGDRPWRAVYGTSGGSQRGVIAVRGLSPVVAPAFAGELAYPDSTLAILPPDADSAAHAWLRNRLGSRVPVTGAIVEIGGRRLLAVVVDLESGGVPGSPKDRLRRIEALSIRNTMASALRAGGVDGVLLAGDLNLVGRTEPLQILSSGPDVDGSGLMTALPLRLDGASAATWENPEEPFTPGRLDFVLIGDAALGAAGGFVFRAADLPAEWRARHGLAADASRVTDHLPIVTDLRWTDTPR
jgi:hypothetical protein